MQKGSINTEPVSHWNKIKVRHSKPVLHLDPQYIGSRYDTVYIQGIS